MARAEKKQKAREAALQLPAVAEDKASTSEIDNVAATPEAAPRDAMFADAATAKLKERKKKSQQTSSEQPASPAGPSDSVLADVPALTSSSLHPAAVIGKRNKKRCAVPGAASAESSPMNGLVNPLAEANSGAVIAAHPPAEAAFGVVTGAHIMRRQPSPGVPVRPYLPPVETQDDSSAGWTVVNGHQRHADTAAAQAASPDLFSAPLEQADVPLGEPAAEDADQNPAEDKIGLAAMEGHYPLRKRGVRAGKRHKKRMGIRQAPSEHSDDDSDHMARGRPMQGQSNIYGGPDASISPNREFRLPPGLGVEVNRQAEHNLRQAKKANALQAAQAAEAAKQEAVQRAHAAAETRRQAASMTAQEPAEDWPALSASGSTSGQLANMHDALVCKCWSPQQFSVLIFT